MMTNLFSVFDPSSMIFVSLNWISSLIVLMILTPMFWVTPNKFFLSTLKICKKLHDEFKMLLGPHSSVGSTIPFISLLMFILMNNFMGLFPYIFTASSHMVLTLTLSLPLWLSFMMYGWLNYTKHMFAHLVPQSTPNLLMPFMVLIESISNVIRPLTLAVRLMANMVAGHLLMTLLGNQTAAASNLILASLILTQILLLTLESAVAMIQSYVFAVLSTLYASEITPH
uniref:ATP synthase subunit a n=1 Tax=Folsomia candida TaxID=158441 RepID=A0A1S5QNH9_FOLCA|nr:ATP synthase F0 subunit 6 [Folsomia candida]AMM04645.1 ATP synthase F0 subunit 6 [Folsomia candida]UHY94343.1 ATP synthase F0 subunit 6 [Folsomia candida]